MTTHEYRNGRKISYYREDTFTGQELLYRAARKIGTFLSDVYTNWSQEKEQAYRECWELYSGDDDARNFRIVSRSSHQFSVAWDRLNEVILLTAHNEYHIIRRV